MTVPAEGFAAKSEGVKPLLAGETSRAMQFGLWVVVLLPTILVAIAAPFILEWDLGPSWLVCWMFVLMYCVGCLGVGVGFHRYFTHGAFKASRWLRVALAIAGSLAIQGPVIQWTADHRRHHAFSDKKGDPHSPWLFGTTPLAVIRGFLHAHWGWLLKREVTNLERFAPDLLADKAIKKVDDLFYLWMTISLVLPSVVCGLVAWSWQEAVAAFFYAGIVRMACLHHVTWSINSICHMIGAQPFASRDEARNVWPLALFSFGESWHNLHHADPTCARHGVLKHQWDINARAIWVFEKLGWATSVRWPTPVRMAKLRVVKK